MKNAPGVDLLSKPLLDPGVVWCMLYSAGTALRSTMRMRMSIVGVLIYYKIKTRMCIIYIIIHIRAPGRISYGAL